MSFISIYDKTEILKFRLFLYNIVPFYVMKNGSLYSSCERI